MGIRANLRIPKFVQNVGLLGLGTAVGQIAVVALSPVLTRLYSPNELGIYGFYSTLLISGLVLSSFRYEAAIALAESERECFEIGSICLMLTIVVVALGAIASSFGLGGTWVSELHDGWAIWVAAGVLVGGVYQTLTAVCIKLGRFGALSTSRAVQGVVLSCAQILFGILGWPHYGLLLGDISGRSASLFPVLATIRRPWVSAFMAMRPTRMLFVLRRHWEFPAFVFPGALLNMLAAQMLLIVGPRHFTLFETGAFFLAYRSLFLPGSLLASTVSQVFLGRIANQTIRGQQGLSTYAVLLGLLSVGTPIYIGLFMHSLTLFPLLFGKDWELSGVYAFLISPQLLVWLPATATSSVLLVNRRFRQSLMVNIAHLALTLIGIFWALQRASFFEGVIATSGLAVALYAFGIYWFCGISEIRPMALFRAYIRSTLSINLLFFAVQFILWKSSPLSAIVAWGALIVPVLALSAKRVTAEIKTAEGAFRSSTI